MEQLYILSNRLVENVSMTYQRYLNRIIDWSEHLIGIRGSRGVGKTTLIKAILGLISFDGTIEVPFSKIEYVPEKFIFPDFITVSKFIQSLFKS